MTTWVVRGVHRDLGQDVTVTVDADDEPQAMRRANRMGIMVESVRAEPVDTGGDGSDEDLSQIAAALNRDPQFTDFETPPAGFTQPIPYRPAAARVPNYSMLLFWCRILAGLAWTSIALAALAVLGGLLFTVLSVIGGATSDARGVGALGGLVGGFGLAGSLLAAIYLLVIGAPIGVLAYGGMAVRDIARNSWRR